MGQNAQVPTDNAAAWDRHAAAYQAGAGLATDVVQYGPDVVSEAELRLLGNVTGKRVLELGCGGAQCAIAMARQGAHVIGVDFSAEQLVHARQLVEREKVRVELHLGDLADLAFIRADAIDLVFSAYAFSYVEDLDRVFRQVNRVLRTECPLVFSLPHPCYDMFDHASVTPLVARRSYFDRRPIDYELNGVAFSDYRHTVGDLFSALTRANFRVEAILEPEPALSGPRPAQDSLRFVPPTIIMRAKKQGR